MSKRQSVRQEDIHSGRVCHKNEKLPILHGPMILLCNFVMRSQIKKPFLKRLIFTYVNCDLNMAAFGRIFPYLTEKLENPFVE